MIILMPLKCTNLNFIFMIIVSNQTHNPIFLIREWSLFTAGGAVEKGGGDIKSECKQLEGGAKFQYTASVGGADFEKRFWHSMILYLVMG